MATLILHIGYFVTRKKCFYFLNIVLPWLKDNEAIEAEDILVVKLRERD
jgi:hypothetical protein